jgi:hypothetical protein
MIDQPAASQDDPAASWLEGLFIIYQPATR